MTKPISRQQHGLLDYGYIPLVAAAPAFAGFAGDKRPTILARAIAGGVLVATLMTRAEWGAVKVLPFKAHLTADLAVGAFALAAPWLLGFANNTRARNTFLGIGAVGLMVDLLTQPDEMATDATTTEGTPADAPPGVAVGATVPPEA